MHPPKVKLPSLALNLMIHFHLYLKKLVRLQNNPLNIRKEQKLQLKEVLLNYYSTCNKLYKYNKILSQIKVLDFTYLVPIISSAMVLSDD